MPHPDNPIYTKKADNPETIPLFFGCRRVMYYICIRSAHAASYLIYKATNHIYNPK